MPVETVVLPRNVVNFVRSPAATSRATRESLAIAAVAASVATVDVDADV